MFFLFTISDTFPVFAFWLHRVAGAERTGTGRGRTNAGGGSNTGQDEGQAGLTIMSSFLLPLLSPCLLLALLLLGSFPIISLFL